MQHDTSLAEELLKIRSDIGIIICTGCSERIDEVKIKTLGVMSYIAKPVIIDELKNSIKEILDISI